MQRRLKIAVSCPGLSGLGGGVKHGLLLLKPLVGLHDITVFHWSGKGIDPQRFLSMYGIDLTAARFEELDHEYSLRRITRDFDVFVNFGFGCLDRTSAAINILLVFFPMPIDDVDRRPRPGHSIQRAKRRLFEAIDDLCPELQDRSLGYFRRRFGLGRSLLALPMFVARKILWLSKMRYRLGYPALDEYDLLLANSEYTAGWIRRYYGKPSEVSYPPIDTVHFVPLAKEKILLSVGRFEPKAMSKRHDALIQVFRALYEEGSLRDWRMVVCGGNDGTPDFVATVKMLRELAEGLPVSIEENAPFSRLRELYGKASVYLHAMGLDEDPELAPWKFEHFGMTTVEAMAAGAVPFVLAAGGQREIVNHGKNGFLWQSRDELKQLLRSFTMLTPAEETRLRDAARERSLEFSEAMFFRRTADMYRRLGVPVNEEP